MVKRMITGVVLLAAIGGAAFSASPGLRVRVVQQWAQFGGWTEQEGHYP